VSEPRGQGALRPAREANARADAGGAAAGANGASAGSPPAGFLVRLQAGIVRALAGFLRRLSPGAVASLGSAAGDLYRVLARRRHRIAIENLTASLGPAVPPERIRDIARDAFRHFGRAGFEMISMDRYRDPSARVVHEPAAAGIPTGAHFVFEGLDHLRAARARGRGVLIFSAHYGNWELGVLLLGYLGAPVGIITRPLDNPLLEDFFRETREASGNRVIGKRSAVRETLRALHAGMGVAMLIDQNVRSGARVFVDFFGRPASTTPTLALLALKTGAPILPMFSFPGPHGSYRFICLPEVAVPATGDRDADVRALTQECTRIIEEQARARPGCWLWMHERWKTRA